MLVYQRVLDIKYQRLDIRVAMSEFGIKYRKLDIRCQILVAVIRDRQINREIDTV